VNINPIDDNRSLKFKKDLEEVFKTEGVPQETFVRPPNFLEVLVDIRQPKKPVVIEGASGSGKTTTLKKIIEKLRIGLQIEYLAARDSRDVLRIVGLINNPVSGAFAIDDFHRLPGDMQARIGELAKLSADSNPVAPFPKIIILGINKVGQSLLQFVPDATKRVSIHRIQSGTTKEIFELLSKGEESLNIKIVHKDQIFEEAKGDYWLTQRLAKIACLAAGVSETQEDETKVEFDLVPLRNRLGQSLQDGFRPAIDEFVRGNRFRPSNDAYFRILQAVAEIGSSSTDLAVLANAKPKIKQTINNVKSGRLHKLLQDRPKAANYFGYNEDTRQFIIEDPAMLYFLRTIDWQRLRSDLGFRPEESDVYEYDLAISFAGENRWIARYIANRLSELDVNVFYDESHQTDLLGKNLTEEFRKVFAEKSRFILCLLDKHYDLKAWPKFEKEVFQFKVRDSSVIPVFLDGTKHVGIPSDIKGFDLKGIKEDDNGISKIDDHVILSLIDKLA
jgi:hypothetical protein